MARKLNEINASSMADISFLLLIFFLVTTSMNVSTGLTRRLPPPLPPDMPAPETDINERNLFIVKINSMNKLLVQNEELDIRDLKEKAKEFIKNANNDPNMPARYQKEFDLLGTMEYTKEHVISVGNDVDTQYQAYIDVQNELVAAYNELRNELAQDKFGKSFDECDERQQKVISEVYPQKISEAEPKNYGGAK